MWIKDICYKNNIQFLGVQESKMRRLDLFSIKSMLGNYSFDYACSLSRGKWENCDEMFYMINIYGPQEKEEKFLVWNRLLEFIRNHEGQFVLFGDMNEIRDKSERYGTMFSRVEAQMFNSFIDDAESDDLTKLEDMNTVRKARITWDVEGDENSKFFHGILKQKRKQQMVKGIMIDGEWITNHHQVKMAFFKFNKDKFEDHDSEMNLWIVMPQVMLDVNDSNELEALVTVDEIKASV
ncbi:RNA-directed DNA polymerase, eukaryota, reverse transcriptase zinc-binding domain protein [Tanacetum coccineum]